MGTPSLTSVFNNFLVNIIYYVTKILCVFFTVFSVALSRIVFLICDENKFKYQSQSYQIGTTLQIVKKKLLIFIITCKNFVKMRLPPLPSNLREFSSLLIFLLIVLRGRGSLLQRKTSFLDKNMKQNFPNVYLFLSKSKGDILGI